MNCLLYYTEKTTISPQFLTQWKHYKRIGLPPITYSSVQLSVTRWCHSLYLHAVVCREGRPVLVTHDAYNHRLYSKAGVPIKAGDAAQINDSKSNVAGSVSSASGNRSHRGDDIDVISRVSRLDVVNADELSESRSQSRSVTVE